MRQHMVHLAAPQVKIRDFRFQKSFEVEIMSSAHSDDSNSFYYFSLQLSTTFSLCWKIQLQFPCRKQCGGRIFSSHQHLLTAGENPAGHRNWADFFSSFPPCSQSKKCLGSPWSGPWHKTIIFLLRKHKHFSVPHSSLRTSELALWQTHWPLWRDSQPPLTWIMSNWCHTWQQQWHNLKRNSQMIVQNLVHKVPEQSCKSFHGSGSLSVNCEDSFIFQAHPQVLVYLWHQT